MGKKLPWEDPDWDIFEEDDKPCKDPDWDPIFDEKKTIMMIMTIPRNMLFHWKKMMEMLLLQQDLVLMKITEET